MTHKKRIMLGATIFESLKFYGSLPQLLAEKGWDVHVVSSPPGNNSTERPSLAEFHPLTMARKPSILRDFFSFLSWLQLVSSIGPNVVCVGTPKASLLGLVAARLLRVPRRVYILRGLRLETLNGALRVVQLALERVTAASATHIVAVSHTLAEKYLELGLCRADKIRVIGAGSSHGVDLKRFHQTSSTKTLETASQLGLDPGIPVLGFVGRFCEDKGASTLVQVRKRLLESGIDHEMLILGPIEDSFYLFEQLKILGRGVKHLETVKNPEDYYPILSILLLPTKREGFPNVVLEAAAAGVPTVATSVTGTPDAIVDEVTGALVKPGDCLAYAIRVEELLLKPEKIEILGRAACARVGRDFRQEEVLAKTLLFFDEILREER